jgi:hypothetical protein
VFGWTVSRHIYLSHSVMRMADGRLHCITPGHTDELNDDGCFKFCEDRAYSFDGQWRRNGVFPPEAPPSSGATQSLSGVTTQTCTSG